MLQFGYVPIKHMEIPADILTLIYAFARPRMRFYKEYRTGLTELGFGPDEHWTLLRNRLCMSDAPRVFAAFLAYKDATLSLRHLNSLPPVPYGEQLYYITFHTEHHKQQVNWKRVDRELRVLLVGEADVLKHERWVRYEIEDMD